MNDQDIRWEQRFNRYQQALLQLAEAIALYRQRPLSNLEQQGLIQAFEFTHELAQRYAIIDDALLAGVHRHDRNLPLTPSHLGVERFSHRPIYRHPQH